MRRFFIMSILTLLALTASSQEKERNGFKIDNMALEVRADFDYYNVKHDTTAYNNSGFSGKYLNFKIFGNITDNLFYAYRQRFNFKNLNSVSDFFDKTDYLYIGWQATDNFALTAGKEVVAMGGIEYDLAPIDVYYNTELWNAIACYQFGLNAIFTTNDKKNSFTAQFTNSPLGGKTISGLYNYSALWRGEYKHFGPLCSVNFFEYQNGKFLNVIALSTSFNFGRFYGYFDYNNRASAKQKNFFFDDMTIDGRVGVYFLKNKLSIFVKAGYDVNKAQDKYVQVDEVYDRLVLPGTDIVFYGGGVEFFPLKKKHYLRVHAYFAVNDTRCLTYINDGSLAHLENTLTYQAIVGLTWRINFIEN